MYWPVSQFDSALRPIWHFRLTETHSPQFEGHRFLVFRMLIRCLTWASAGIIMTDILNLQLKNTFSCISIPRVWSWLDSKDNPSLLSLSVIPGACNYEGSLYAVGAPAPSRPVLSLLYLCAELGSCVRLWSLIGFFSCIIHRGHYQVSVTDVSEVVKCVYVQRQVVKGTCFI